MERFTITRVSDKNINKGHNNEVALNVGDLGARGNTLAVHDDHRKFSFAQLTR